jgi:hypothetical protein
MEEGIQQIGFEQPKKSSGFKIFFIVIAVFFILIVLGVICYFVFLKNDGKSENEAYCSDSDGGLDYNVLGVVEYRQLLSLDEATYKNILSVNSDTDANLNFGGYNGIVRSGETYTSVAKDQTYTDNNQENILRNVPTTIQVKRINYYGQGNDKNSIEIEQITNNPDECTSKYGGDSKGLIETACTRQIDEFYRCPNECLNGACV